MKSLSLLRCKGTCNRTSLHWQARPRAPRPTRLVCRALTDKAQVLDDVRGVVAEQIGTELDKVLPESTFATLGADSLDTVEILMALEEKFDIQLDEEGAEKVTTVQDAAELICTQIK